MVDLSKRDLLKLSGLAGGAVALGSGLSGCGLGSSANAATGLSPEKNTLFASLPEYKLGSNTESSATIDKAFPIAQRNPIPVGSSLSLT